MMAVRTTCILLTAVTSYFFHQTKRGGTGKGKKEKTKLMHIAHWFQCQIMWITGLGDDVYENMSH
jgi:hypothetical protein